MKAAHDMWMFNKDGGTLFKAGEEIPAGYVDSPAKVGSSDDDAPKRRGRPPKSQDE